MEKAEGAVFCLAGIITVRGFKKDRIRRWKCGYLIAVRVLRLGSGGAFEMRIVCGLGK